MGKRHWQIERLASCGQWSRGWFLPFGRNVSRRPMRQQRHEHFQVEPLEARKMLAVFTVDTNSDVPVEGFTTFREAITLANDTAGADQIVFNIPSPASTVIAVQTALPDITEEVLIDGASQPGTGFVSLDGSAAGGADGLVVMQGGSGTAIVSLRIGGFVNGIQLVATAGVNVIDCMLGSAGGGPTNSEAGILVNGGVDNQLTRITAAGNGGSGVQIVAAAGTQIIDSLLGLAATPNAAYGLFVDGGDGTTVTVSGTAGSAKVTANGLGGISATDTTNLTVAGITLTDNTGHGIEIRGGSAAVLTGNTISGNGASTADSAIRIFGGSSHTIGSTLATDANTIISNKGDGIVVVSAEDTVIQRNLIGTKTVLGGAYADAGNVGIGIRLIDTIRTVVTYRNVIAFNDLGGVVVTDGVDNIIGADDSRPLGEQGQGFGNYVFANDAAGVIIAKTASNTVVAGNSIGIIGPNGTLSGNKGDGIGVLGATGTVVGGRLPAAAGDPVYGNLVSGNLGSGITLSGNEATSSTESNFIRGNTIRSNALSGIRIDNSVLDVVGGNIEDAVPDFRETANTIIANGTSGQGDGISIENNSSRILVSGNFIGTNSVAAAGLGNLRSGIRVASSDDNIIGGTTDSGSQNVIANNTLDGVSIVTLNNASPTTSASGNFVVGNTIRGNGRRGIFVEGANNNIIGTSNPGEGNLVVANVGDGIGLVSAATGNTVRGNLIGTDVAGSARLGNLGIGVSIDTSTANVIGGPGEGEGNRIAYNRSGVSVFNAMATTNTANQILGNQIDRNIAQGVRVTGSRFTVVGGLADGEGNAVWFNGGDGVLLDGTTQSVQVLGNNVGTDAEGNNLGNAGDGIQFGSHNTTVNGNTLLGNRIGFNAAAGVRLMNATQSTVGGFGNGEANTVIFNRLGGIVLQTGSQQNRIAANSVSDNLAAGLALLASSGNTIVGNELVRNAVSGVTLSGSSNNTIGIADGIGGNTIANNIGYGVVIADTSSRNTLAANTVSENTGAGIVISSGLGNRVVAGNTVTLNGSAGILLSGTSRGTVIDAAYVGTNASGDDALGNRGSGISIAGSIANVIGGGSLVSGNTQFGIDIFNAMATDTAGGNVVTSSTVNNNGLAGIRISGGGRHTIGGRGLGNTIEGNVASGIELSGRTIGNVVRGNSITDSGTDGLLLNTATGNIIDGGNVITVNGGDGIRLVAAASGNQIRGNFVGTDGFGTDELGNSGDGIEINASIGNVVSGNVIAGQSALGGRGVAIVSSLATTLATGNLVEANLVRGNTIGVAVMSSTRQTIGTSRTSVTAPANTANTIIDSISHGVLVNGKSVGVVVAGNWIGVNAGGAAGVNAGDGVRITASTASIVAGNAISNSGGHGVHLTAAPAPGASNVITTNTIRGNTGSGVRIGEGSTFNVVGNVNAGNTIEGNSLHGVVIEGLSNFNRLTSNTVAGNGSIDATSAVVVGDGVRVVGSIGTVVRSSTMSGNAAAGVRFVDAFATKVADGNQLLASTVASNAAEGVRIEGGSRHIVGGAGLGNTIVDNGTDEALPTSTRAGIAIVTGTGGRASLGNLIQANSIGITAQGGISGNAGDGILIQAGSGNEISLGNRIANNGRAGQGVGIRLQASSANMVGGTIASAGNTISFNEGGGVLIESLGAVGSTGNSVSANTIDGNKGDGVAVIGAAASVNTIGMSFNGTAVRGLGNVISNNAGTGVSVNASIRNSVLGNSLFGNAAAIALTADGNATMPAPSIRSASAVRIAGGSRWTIAGGITGAPPRQQIVVEFYANPLTTDAPQARTLIGRAIIRTDAMGAGTFRVMLTSTSPVTSLITASATSVLGNTSEVAVPSNLRAAAFSRAR